MTWLALAGAARTHWRLVLLLCAVLAVFGWGAKCSHDADQRKLDALAQQVANQKVTVRIDKASLAQAMLEAGINAKETIREQKIIERGGQSIVRIQTAPGANTALPAGVASAIGSQLRAQREAARAERDLHDAGAVPNDVPGTGR